MADDGGNGGGGGSAAGEPFDFEDWKRRLYELNPWAVGLQVFAFYGVTEAFEQARKTASVKRWAEGQEVWNAWAKAMLALKAEAGRDDDAKKLCQELTYADFSGLCLSTTQKFIRYMFPGEASFSGTVFGDQEKSPGGISFYKAVLSGRVDFSKAQFSGGHAIFAEIRCKGSVNFTNAQFSGGEAYLARAVFRGSLVDFTGAKFSGGDVSFSSAKFSGGEARFENTVFFKRVSFENTRFDSFFSNRVLASFVLCSFQGPARFSRASFQEADFSAMTSERAFSMADARFETTPNFIEAKFHKPPRLDNILIRTQPAKEAPKQEPRPWWAKGFLVAPDKDEHARFRELRAMATDGNDHVNALRFNAREIIARRFWVDKPYPLEEGDTWENCHAARFWLGWLYGVFSDYGRSILRPLMWEIGLVALFAVVFLALAVAEEGPRPKAAWNACHASYLGDEQKTNQETNRITEAFALSKRNVLFIGRADTARRTYGCLYGLENEGRSGRVPPWVGFLSSLQSILSAILLFLVGLAIRNMFRIG